MPQKKTTTTKSFATEIIKNFNSIESDLVLEWLLSREKRGRKRAYFVSQESQALSQQRQK